MYRLFSFYRWRAPLLCVLVAAVTVLAFGEGVVLYRSSVSVDAVADDRVPLPVIMYHGLLEDTARQGQYIIAPALFERDLQTVQQAGYTTVLVADLLAYVEQGTPLPEKPILLTFDDGYYNNYLYAYPLLKKYGMKAVISPVCRWSQQYSASPSQADHAVYSHITWEEMREMTASGLVEIQNHSYNMHYTGAGHRKGTLPLAGESAAAYAAALREDLSQAQRCLTDFAGVTPTAFFYPYGAVSKQARGIIKELGFRASFTCEARMNHLSRTADSLYNLGRYLRPSGVDSQAYFAPIFRAAEQ